MLLQTIFLIISFIILWISAEILITYSSKLSKNFNISPAIIGINIGLMTSLPELIVSLVAINNHNPEIVIGNILGSNIANIALIIGFCTIIAPIPFTKHSIKNCFFIVFLSCLITILALIDYKLSLIDGIILLIILFFFLYNSLFQKKSETQKIKKNNGASKNILFIVISIIILTASAKLLIYSANNIAIEMNISSFFISLSVIAIGTSLPELITSIVALKKGYFEICISNILGSNIYNILLVLGTSSVISSLPIKRNYLNNEFMWLCVSAILLMIFFLINYKKKLLTRINGIIFLSLYALFIYSIIPS